MPQSLITISEALCSSVSTRCTNFSSSRPRHLHTEQPWYMRLQTASHSVACGMVWTPSASQVLVVFAASLRRTLRRCPTHVLSRRVLECFALSSTLALPAPTRVTPVPPRQSSALLDPCARRRGMRAQTVRPMPTMRWRRRCTTSGTCSGIAGAAKHELSSLCCHRRSCTPRREQRRATNLWLCKRSMRGLSCLTLRARLIRIVIGWLQAGIPRVATGCYVPCAHLVSRPATAIGAWGESTMTKKRRCGGRNKSAGGRGHVRDWHCLPGA